MHLKEIAHMLGTDALQEREITGFEQDSRLIAPGNLFFALKGAKWDGHAFLQEVAQRGAYAAIVSKEYAQGSYGLCLLRVDDVFKALQTLSSYVHAARSQRVIAVTGSVGKTTTKEFISTLLMTHFKVAKTPGNANSQVSVPLSILNARGDEEVFVIEMGMSQPGEIGRLVQIAPPEIALVTNISPAHVVFFQEGIEGIARAKAEIFSSPRTRLGIVSAQAAQFPSIMQAGGCLKITYAKGDYFFVDTEEKRIVEKGIFSPPLPLAIDATHMRENALAAIAVAREMGVSWETICSQIPKLKSIAHRFERQVRDGIVFIDDSYNANVTSMKAALQNLPSVTPPHRRIAVLGAMKELGIYTQDSHREVAECALHHIDYLLCLGEECQIMLALFQEAKRPAELFFDIAAVKKRVFEIAKPGDVVLLKGSRSNQLWDVLA